MPKRNRHGFFPSEWLMGLVAACVVPAFGACTRAGSPVPASDTVAKPVESAATVATAEWTPQQPVASAPATPAPAAPASASASSAPAAAAPAAASNPWTTAEDCSVYDKAPEYRDLSAEDRARSRATCEAKEEFRTFVAARQSCSSASDCTNVSGSCPFGCFVPVAKGSASAVKAKLETLGSRLHKAGHRCVYRCMGEPAETCESGRCTNAAR